MTNWALAAASMGIVVLLGEAAARVAESPRGGRAPGGGLDLYMLHDPVLGWRHRPGSRSVFNLGEYTVDMTINSRGLRGPERDYEAAPRTWRLLALGDSFVEAFSVRAEQSVTEVLEGSLRRGSCPVEVLNGGTAAYSTDQEYLFYSREGFKYGPQIVALFFFFNDVLGNINDDGKPVLRAAGGTLVPRDGAVPPPRPRAHRVPADPPPRRGSALVRWIAKRLRSGAPRAYNLLAGAGLWDRIKPERARSDFEVYQIGPNPQVDESWDLTRDILDALARSVAAHGSRFLLVYVPSRMEVSERDWELTSLHYGWNDQNASRSRVVKRLGRIARSLGIPFLDLTPALQRAGWGPFGGPYYVEDFHWNSVGHRVAATEVESFLRGRGWLPSCAGAP